MNNIKYVVYIFVFISKTASNVIFGRRFHEKTKPPFFSAFL